MQFSHMLMCQMSWERKKLDKKGQKCIFVGYFEDTKAYKLYDPVAKKVIISCDVQFVENESWDGNVKKNVKIVSNVEHEDMMEEVVQTPQVNQPVTTPSTPMTPRHGSSQGISIEVATQATPTSTPRGQQTPSSSLTSTDLVKTRSLREIYKSGTSTSSHVWFFLMHSISSSMYCAHTSSSTAYSNVSGSYIGENNAKRENEFGVPASYISRRLLVFIETIDVE